MNAAQLWPVRRLIVLAWWATVEADNVRRNLTRRTALIPATQKAAPPSGEDGAADGEALAG